MKKFSLLLLIGLLMLTLVVSGCAPQEQKQGEEKKSAEEKKQTYTIKIGINQPIDSPEYKGAEIFKKELEEKSDGQLVVELYPSMQLGSMREQTEGVQMGSIEMTLQPVAVLTPFTPDVQLMDLPFLFPTNDILLEVGKGEAGKEILASMAEKNMVGLGFWSGGAKHFTTNDIEIHVPADFKGVKMRVMPSPLLIAQYEAWGANPIPIEYAELYNALQQGVVDGQENPLQTIALNKFYEVQNTMILSGHGYMTYVMVANKSWFESLPQELQNLIKEANLKASEEESVLVKENEAKFLEEIKNSGIKVYALTDEEKAKFIAASKPVHEEFAKTEKQKAILEKIYAEVEKLQ